MSLFCCSLYAVLDKKLTCLFLSCHVSNSKPVILSCWAQICSKNSQHGPYSVTCRVEGSALSVFGKHDWLQDFSTRFNKRVSTQSCPTLCDPWDCSPPGSSVPRIFQARILEWVAISFSRIPSQPRNWTQVSCVSCTYSLPTVQAHSNYGLL